MTIRCTFPKTLQWKKSTRIEDVFPIENGDFLQEGHVSSPKKCTFPKSNAKVVGKREDDPACLLGVSRLYFHGATGRGGFRQHTAQSGGLYNLAQGTGGTTLYPNTLAGAFKRAFLMFTPDFLGVS